MALLGDLKASPLFVGGWNWNEIIYHLSKIYCNLPNLSSDGQMIDLPAKNITHKTTRASLNNLTNL